MLSRRKFPRNPPKSRKPRIDELALGAAERHHAKAAALIAGADKLLSDFIGNQSWGTEITIDVALQLLTEAKDEREAGAAQYRKATAGDRPRRVRGEIKFAGGNA